MTTTVGDLIDRIYRDYLHPGDEQPAQAFLTQAVGAADQTITIDVSSLSDVVSMLGPGLLLEVDQEWMISTSWDSTTRQFGVRRGHEHTEAESHDADDRVLISPQWSRRTVFDAVADAIDGLYPSVYRRATIPLSAPGAGSYYTPAPADMVGALFYAGGTQVQSLPVHYVPHHPLAPNGVIQLPEGGLSDGYLVYKATFTRPTAENQELASLGVTDRTWHRVIIVGALAQVIGGRDMPRMSIEFITKALETQDIPVGTASSLRRALMQFHNELLQQAEARQLASDTPVVERAGVVELEW